MAQIRTGRGEAQEQLAGAPEAGGGDVDNERAMIREGPEREDTRLRNGSPWRRDEGKETTIPSAWW